MRLKERNNELVARAYDLLTGKKESDYKTEFYTKDGVYIDKGYDGQVAAFSVSVAMIGLRPTLAMYYKKGGSAVDTHNIVGIIAEMLIWDNFNFTEGNNPAEKLFRYVMDNRLEKEKLDQITRDVIDMAVALKVVVRTFLEN